MANHISLTVSASYDLTTLCLPQVLVQQQKSRAFYRIQATRMMIGAGNILKKHAADQARKVVSSNEQQEQEDDPFTTRLDFQPVLYQCFENCGSLKLTVARRGGDAGCTVKVRESGGEEGRSGGVEEREGHQGKGEEKRRERRGEEKRRKRRGKEEWRDK